MTPIAKGDEPMTNLTYACIGAGGIADKKHLSQYSKIENLSISAICDVNTIVAEKMAAKYHISSVYTDYHKMLDEVKPDIVSICTANHLHRQITIDALQSGSHVHLEKPIALNAKEAEEIVAVQKATGKKIMLGLNNRFLPEFSYLMKCINEGFFGDIYHAKCGWLRRNGIPGKGVWFTDKEKSGGGPLIDLGVHYLDIIFWLLKYPKVTRVSSTTYCTFADQDHRLRPGYKNIGDGLFNVEDMVVGTLFTKDKTTVQFEFSWASNIERETKYCELLGTKGGAVWRDGELKLFTEIAKTGVIISPDLSLVPPLPGECAQFVNAIQQNKPSPASAEEGLFMMQIIDAAYLSADENREVCLDYVLIPE